MTEMPPIEHHQAIVKQINQQTKCSLIDQLPRMRQVTMIKVQNLDKSADWYDLSWIKGEIVLKMLCQDGLIILVRVE